ncbi:unnamed protein product [Paramecium pentaurelia]|uniref:Protein kinase domain-containing protein n=1 Tax=Paramecium pentaurelia TaxID=43138 RepID=A0A8S1TFX7_9CILI|nr:unnamed protein product [Paramecium pentaurelia]
MKRYPKKNIDQIQNKIEYEASHRKSFFQRKFVRMEWSRRKIPKVQGEFDLQIEVMLIGKHNLPKKKQLMVWQNIMKTTKRNGDNCWLDYENSILESLQNEEYGEGIKLTKCFDEIIIFGEVASLFPIIRRFTIQLDFLKQFEVIKQISQETYRIQRRNGSRDYQCSIYQKNQLTSQIEAQLEKQIYIQRRINYEYLQQFYEVFESPEQIIVITELTLGGTLSNYIQKFPTLSEEKAQKLMFKIFKGLAYLHSKNIMHRDIKPENIWLGLNGSLENPCLSSYGLAEIVQQNIGSADSDNEQQTPEYLMQRFGTPGYTAPEILRNEYYDQKADVFSAGIVMYYSLCGKIPFQGPNLQCVIESNLECHIDYSKLYLSDEGVNFIRSILNENPNERISSQLALNHQWFKKERLSEVMEFKASQKLKQLTEKNSSQRGQMKSYNQQALSQDASPLSPQSPQITKLQRQNSDFRIRAQCNSFSPEVSQFRKQSSFTSKSNRISQNQVSPLNDEIKKSRYQMKKSIFKN